MLVNIWEGDDPEVAREEAAAYCMRWGIEGTVLMDFTASYARTCGIRGVPTNIYVGDDGRVRCVGATSSEAMVAEAERLEPRLATGPGSGGRNGSGPLPLDFIQPS